MTAKTPAQAPTRPLRGERALTPPTPRQRDVLALIVRLTAERGFAPSRAEIASAMGWRSTHAVRAHVDELERKGYLARTPGVARSLRVLRVPDEADAAA